MLFRFKSGHRKSIYITLEEQQCTDNGLEFVLGEIEDFFGGNTGYIEPVPRPNMTETDKLNIDSIIARLLEGKTQINC